MTVALAHDDHGVLYRGGRIRTVDPAMPAAEAVATRSGIILAVGSEESCRSALGFTGTTTEGVVDLAGRALLPGFNDAHMELMVSCFFALHVDLSSATCLSDVLDALADRARATDPGDWVVGLRLSPDQLAEERLPTIAELDAVGAGRPLVVLLRDCHTSVGNTLALAGSGIRDRRPDPPGGRFGRDDHGHLTGECHEAASALLLGPIPIPDLEELRAAAKGLIADITAQGITSLGVVLQTDDEGPGGAARALETVGMMVLANEVPQGLHTLVYGNPAKVADLRRSSPLHHPGRNRIVGGVKLCQDGSLSTRTAYMHQPYVDRPGEQGFLTTDRSAMARRMEYAHRAGLQVCVRAVGDAAAAHALGLLAEVLELLPDDPTSPAHHRIEHLSMVDEQTPTLLADLNVAAVVQPSTLSRHGDLLARRLGAARWRQAFPFRTLVDAGVVVAGSSNHPMETTDVLTGIAAAVARPGFEKDEALTATQAIEMYTRSAAIAQRRDDVTGTITEGKRADLVVLSDDPAAVPPDEIAGIEVRQTVIGGQVVHRAASVG